MGQRAADLGKGLKSGADTTVAARQLVESAKALESAVGPLDLGPGTTQAWKVVRDKLDRLATIYGL